MITQNIKITFRNARRNGALSFAKLFGISISIAVILFAASYVYYETSFDKNVPDHDRIYRCVMQGIINGREADFAVTSPAMAAAIKEGIPEIKTVTRMRHRGNATIQVENKSIEAGQMLVADASFFSFFGIPVISEHEIIFQDPDDIAISESLAKTHFGSVEKALNKRVQIRGEDCMITGVFKDVPKNFHLQSKLIKNIEDEQPEKVGWGSQNYYTYLKTFSPTDNIEELSFKLSKTVYTHWNEEIDGANANTWEDLKYNPGTYVFFNAEPLREIHFSNHRFDPAVTANKTYVYGAIVLSVLVLLISSINYVNLTIANFSTRFKEIGIRKTTGARTNQIARLFVNESVMFWIIGFGLALLIYELSIQKLSAYLGFEINITNTDLFKITIGSFLILMAFNLLTVLFPILYASGKQVLGLIKEDKTSTKKLSAKSSFVFLQFVLSALIILSTIIVQKQVRYLVNKDRGYDQENIMTIGLWNLSPEKRKSFIEELKSFTPIKSVSTSEAYLGEDPSMNGAFFEKQEDESYFHTSLLPVDFEFPKTFNLELSEGRFFNKDKQTDYESALINETAANEYKGKGSLIGKKVLIDGSTYNIIGIVKDFNFRSLYHEIQPLVITPVENQGNVFIKVQNNQIPQVIDIVQNQYKKFNNDGILDYTFHDDVIAKHYVKDQQAKKLLLFLSIISITISCIGLYAISFFITIRKTKEIGIRKVNGAKLAEIMVMLNRNFLKWVFFAFIIACPVSYFVMMEWLKKFAYRTAISWWVFSLAGAIALVIALLTVSWQSWRAANKNPVEALRYE